MLNNASYPPRCFSALVWIISAELEFFVDDSPRENGSSFSAFCFHAHTRWQARTHAPLELLRGTASTGVDGCRLNARMPKISRIALSAGDAFAPEKLVPIASRV